MEAKEYQKVSARTLISEPERPLTPTETMQVWCAMGMAGEAGEASEIVKKHVFHHHPLDVTKLVSELGDVLWYLTQVCTLFDIRLTDVMDYNIRKLEQRYHDGFSSAASATRPEEKVGDS